MERLPCLLADKLDLWARKCDSEQEFLAFAKSYLSEAFPNPERIGRPSHSDLMHLAEHPRGAELSITEHLSCCSPSFKEYVEILAVLKGLSKA